MAVIKDWVVQPQWDDSKIAKGLSRIEKSIQRVNKYKKQDPSISKSGKSKQEIALEREIRLRTKKNTLLGQLNRAEKLGLRNLDKYQNKLKSSKELTIKKAVADLSQEIRNKERDILRGKEQQLTAEKAISQQRRIQTQQYTMQERLKTALFRTDQQIAAARGARGGGETVRELESQRAGLMSIGERLAGTTLTLEGLRGLKSEYNQIGRQASLTKAKVRDLTKDMTAQQFASKGLKDSINNLARSYLSIFAIIAGSSAMYDIGKQLDQVQASMLAVSKSTEGVARDWEFVNKTAVGLGIDLKTSAKGFQQIGVAAEAMGFKMEQAKNIFLAAAESSRAFNLSTEDQMGVQRAEHIRLAA